MPDQFEQHSILLNNNHQLAWRECGAGNPLVMLHGWSMSSAVFTEVAAAMATRYRVLCPDLPGHGQSGPPQGCHLDSYADALQEWLAALDIKEYSLLGWSLGGQVSMVLSGGLCPPDNLILVSSTPRFCQSEDWSFGLPVTQVKALERNMKRGYEKTLGDFFNQQFAAGEISQQRKKQIIKFAVRSGSLPESDLAIKALDVLSHADLRPELNEIAVRTQVVHGLEDQIIPCLAGEFISREISSAKFVGLSGVGHAPFFSQPEKCVDLWMDFLSGC